MSNYTKLNLLELKDSVGDRAPGIEGRFGRTKLGARDIGVSYFRYAPGFRSSMGHRHREQEEAYVVVAGSGRAKLEDEIIEIGVWDVLRGATGHPLLRGRPGRHGADLRRRPRTPTRRQRAPQ
jgi:hypothetical protein